MRYSEDWFESVIAMDVIILPGLDGTGEMLADFARKLVKAYNATVEGQ